MFGVWLLSCLLLGGLIVFCLQRVLVGCDCVVCDFAWVRVCNWLLYAICFALLVAVLLWLLGYVCLLVMFGFCVLIVAGLIAMWVCLAAGVFVGLCLVFVAMTVVLRDLVLGSCVMSFV